VRCLGEGHAQDRERYDQRRDVSTPCPRCTHAQPFEC
jgi:hypothetical protein